VDIKKHYKDFTLEVSFHNEEGTLGILGASGSGKSLTLKCIAGLESPDEGVIVSGGRTLFDSAAKIDLTPQERNVGYLFQSYALFPHMTVRENIAIAVRERAWNKTSDGARNKASDKAKDKEAFIDGLLDRYELTGFGDRYPAKLSGGQQQRAALARIFAYGPELLMLDEPFSALDAFLRENMQIELLRIISEYDGDVILVTHSRDEVYKICDKLLIMDRGRIVANGGTRAVFADPASVTAARVTGCKNISRIRRLSERRLAATEWGIELETGRSIKDEHTHIGVRAHDFSPARASRPAAPERFSENAASVHAFPAGRLPENAAAAHVFPAGGLPADKSSADGFPLNEFPVTVEGVFDGPFEKTVLLRAGGEADSAAGGEAGGARGIIRWICSADEDVSDVDRLLLGGGDILLLTE
jgi:molybdate transport system ATP-binding protein